MHQAVETHAISERRACRLFNLGRSSCRYRLRRVQDDKLLTRLRELATARPRFGYRRLWALLRREGWGVNHKRVYQLYKKEGLAMRRKVHKRRCVQPPTPTRVLSQINQQWSVD